MSALRPFLALTAAVVLVAALPSAAAPRPKPKPKPKVSCNLIVDTTKDTFLLRSQDTLKVYGPQEDGVDIVSGDLASNVKTLTGVFRVVKLAKTIQSAPGGIDFRLQFLLPGQDPSEENFVLNARTDRGGVATFLLGLKTQLPFEAQSTTAKLADGTGTFDLKKNEVRIHVPVAAVKSGDLKLKTGSKLQLGGLDQTASRQVVVNPATGIGTAVFADVTTSDKSYVAGSRSCVPPGR